MTVQRAETKWGAILKSMESENDREHVSVDRCYALCRHIHSNSYNPIGLYRDTVSQDKKKNNKLLNDGILLCKLTRWKNAQI